MSTTKRVSLFSQLPALTEIFTQTQTPREGGIALRLSDRYEIADIPDELYVELLKHFQRTMPDQSFRSWIALPQDDTTIPVATTAIFYDHAVVNQARYTSLLRSNAGAEALVTVRINSAGASHVGELLEVFSVTLPDIGTHRFGYIRWLCPFDGDISSTMWRDW